MKASRDMVSSEMSHSFGSGFGSTEGVDAGSCPMEPPSVEEDVGGVDEAVVSVEAGGFGKVSCCEDCFSVVDGGVGEG